LEQDDLPFEQDGLLLSRIVCSWSRIICPWSRMIRVGAGWSVFEQHEAGLGQM